MKGVAANSRGALSLPLSMMLVASAIAGFGLLSLMRHWRQLTALQLRLDQCVGQTALDLKESLQRVEAENTQIRVLRAAQAMADLAEEPGVMVAEIEAEAAAQDAEILMWRTRQSKWMLARGCDAQSDLPSPLPPMQWDPRLPADIDGPQPLKWSGSEKRLRLQLSHLPRAAAAVVEAGQIREGAVAVIEGVMGANHWKASWVVPGALGAKLFRPNID